MDPVYFSTKWLWGFGRVMLVPQLVLKWVPLLNGTGCLVESCWCLKTLLKIYPNFALQLNQGPTFSSEIRSCMRIHLVELEAMQAVSSLQNGCTAPPLNWQGGTNFNYIVRSMVNLMLAIDQSWSFLSLGCIFLHVISCSLPSLPSLGWFQGKSETLPIFDGQNSLVSGDYPVHPECSIRHSSPDNGWVNDGQWMGSWLGKPSING